MAETPPALTSIHLGSVSVLQISRCRKADGDLPRQIWGEEHASSRGRLARLSASPQPPCCTAQLRPCDGEGGGVPSCLTGSRGCHALDSGRGSSRSCSTCRFASWGFVLFCGGELGSRDRVFGWISVLAARPVPSIVSTGVSSGHGGSPACSRGMDASEAFEEVGEEAEEGVESHCCDWSR
eukprot:441551-Pleurochrysis_carterae.AAC.1